MRRALSLLVISVACFTLGALLPLHAPVAAKAADPHACPTGSSLLTYEDGSGGCYQPGNTKPVLSWDEDTFPWDCRTMGNQICGPTVSAGDCTYFADGSGQCPGERIPTLTEYDADFCGDVDPLGAVIVLCKALVHNP